MEYLIIIPVSTLHRGTLQIYWVPAGATTTTTPTVAALNTIYDVAASEETIVRVGYAQDAPYLDNYIIPSAVTILPTAGTNGRLVFLVVNPLQSQNSAVSVDVLVFGRACSNMDFQVLDGTIATYDSTGLKVVDLQTPCVQYQGAQGDETEEQEIIDLVPPSGEYPAVEINFGEKVNSARTMLQKFTWLEVANYIYKNGHYYQCSFGQAQFVFSQHYALLFAGLASGTRLKLLGFSGPFPCLASARVTHPDVLGNLSLTNNNMLLPIQNMTSLGAEFRLPYYSPRKFLKTNVAVTGVPYLYDIAQVADLNGVVNNDVTSRFAVALASDIRCLCFSHVPNLFIRTTGSRALGWWQ